MFAAGDSGPAAIVPYSRVNGDRYWFLDDPQQVVDGLWRSELRIDLFTFMQKFPEISPKYIYPMEWDSSSVLPISTSPGNLNGEIRLSE
jgi:hypothetical protein